MHERLFNSHDADPLLSSWAKALHLIHYDIGQHDAPRHDFIFPYQPLSLKEVGLVR
jgi:hypothetical protein